MALRWMEKGGVTLTSTHQVNAELAGNCATPEGSQQTVRGGISSPDFTVTDAR
jgi:hypothetical protein